MTVAIGIRDVTKRFGGIKALDGLNLSVQPGEFLVLLGPSGCGKTTLLRCLAGLEEPDQGEIQINGEVVFSDERGITVSAAKRQVGMVFQSYALWPHMKVKENIGFGLRVQKMARQEIQERVTQVLSDLDMEGLEERYPSELSGGQQQRVALARLMATRPPVFLMDEPLSNLDARLRTDMRADLKRLHWDAGATTVYVTHDQVEAMTMASMVVVMRDGRIQQAAPPAEIYRRPANIFVADFIGMPRINLLPARASCRDGQHRLEIGDFTIPLAGDPGADELTVAARPEDLALTVEPESNAIEFQVYSVQATGPEQLIHVRRGAITLIVRDHQILTLQMDQTVWITFDVAALSIYDSSSGDLLPDPVAGRNTNKNDAGNDQSVQPALSTKK